MKSSPLKFIPIVAALITVPARAQETRSVVSDPMTVTILGIGAAAITIPVNNFAACKTAVASQMAFQWHSFDGISDMGPGSQSGIEATCTRPDGKIAGYMLCANRGVDEPPTCAVRWTVGQGITAPGGPK